MLRPLLVGGLHDDRWPAVEQTDEIDTHVGRAEPLGLLEEDQVLGRRGSAAPELLRPVDPRVPGVEQLALPRGVVRAARREVVLGRARGDRGQHLVQPRPQLVTKGELVGGEAKIHGRAR